ncbi:MAG: N-acetylmuramoyl-L-alanine amidase [Lachnospiraceae bacterium]|nr:N-acetylmuramoyl-L-alanine amidase [Lachnospiraceae bacterium]
MTAFADTAYVNASNLNFRKSAQMTGEVIRLLPRGTKVERAKDLGEWSEVTVDGVTGFVASRYLVAENGSAGSSASGNAENNGASGKGAEADQAQAGAVTAQIGGGSEYTSQSWEVSLDMNAQYAANSKINSGKAIYYVSSGARKEKTICVNAGHGTKGGSAVKTLCHPDGSAKVTGGTTSAGATTAVAVSSGMTFQDGTPESTVTLEMAKILRDKLLKEGYDVLMIRETDDVQLDNIARTVLANTNADCHIALHWDSTTTDKGCFFMSVPNNATYRAMEPVASHWESHNKLGSCLIEGLRQNGNKIFSSGAMEMDLTQTSYSTIPSVDIELGDKASAHTTATLEKMADGLLVGVNDFFK